MSKGLLLAIALPLGALTAHLFWKTVDARHDLERGLQGPADVAPSARHYETLASLCALCAGALAVTLARAWSLQTWWALPAAWALARAAVGFAAGAWARGEDSAP